MPDLLSATAEPGALSAPAPQHGEVPPKYLLYVTLGGTVGREIPTVPTGTGTAGI